MKDWQVTYKGMPVGTLGEMQGFDDLMDFGLIGSDKITIDNSLEMACTLKGISFKRLLRSFGIKRGWLDSSLEWSNKCRAIRRKLREAFK
jgi:hypothetical protein